MSAEPITQDMIDCWRMNYGLDTRSPEAAARWWDEHYKGMAPAGAVAALGLLLEERATLDAAVAAARAEERERCAKACVQAKSSIWEMHDHDVQEAARNVCDNLARAIRDLKPEGE